MAKGECVRTFGISGHDSTSRWHFPRLHFAIRRIRWSCISSIDSVIETRAYRVLAQDTFKLGAVDHNLAQDLRLWCSIATARDMPVPAPAKTMKIYQVDTLLPEHIHAQAASREIIWNIHVSEGGLPMIQPPPARAGLPSGFPSVSCCPKRHRVDPTRVRPDTTSLS